MKKLPLVRVKVGIAACITGLAILLQPPSATSAPIASLDYHIAGTFLQVNPITLSVPTGIAGSVLVSVVAGGSTNGSAVAQLTTGAYVQAVIRGPAFATPQTIVATPNSSLILPVINLAGQYELDNIELVDANTGQVRLDGAPSSVPVNVFSQLLISSVTSQPLSLDQIQQAGIDIDESSFQAVQFSVEFVVDGQTIPVTFPVVSPIFTDTTELVPADQVQAQLAHAASINQQISSTMVQLPPQLQTAGLNLQIQGINFQVTDPSPDQSLQLPIPPIPALIVIPGSVGYLHEFFSVQIFTENGAPIGSGLSVGDLTATLQLPPGPDGIVSTNWAAPGEDPLRFARTGSNQIVQPTQQIVDPGASGDQDITVLQPGETGQAQFLVEGLQEGLAVMNVDLEGELYGLTAGPVHISGSAAGSVLVRNPTFSMTFSYPDVVRVGEPYQASITLLNTGVTPANLVSVTLNQNSISGAELAPNQPQTIQLGTIQPGQSATATYNMVSETTGQVEFSDLTTSDASLTGQFNFSMGVDPQGVPLSPDSIALPAYVYNLPADLVAAANIVLGEALSIATAAKLPPGIVPVDNAIITRRVLDLAEAGQRVQYGDPLSRVLPDLLRDWQGGRVPDAGFDAEVRTSIAGANWRSILFKDMEAADHLDGTQRALAQAADLAGLGQQFVLASAGPGQLWVDLSGSTNAATTNESSVPYSMVYGGTNGEWAVTPYLTNAVFTWTFTNGPASADIAVLEVNSNGQAQELRWQIANPPVTAIYQFALSDPTQKLQVDTQGNGTVDTTLSPSSSVVNELPPTLVAVQQDLAIVAGRPSVPCVGPSYGNYGTVVAVVYSKPMDQASAGANASYTVGGSNYAYSVQIQPSGRVALINMRKGISAIIPRALTIAGVTDLHGNALVPTPTLIQCYYPGTTEAFTGGVAVNGRVLLGSGAPAAGVPVTLTMYDGQATPDGCISVVRRVSQVLTDSGGNYNLDYVMSGIPYTISASDTTGLSTNAIQLIEESIITTQPNTQVLQQLINAATNSTELLSLLAAGSLGQAVAIVQGLDRAVVQDVIGIGSSREGQTVPIVLRFRGTATVNGQVVAADGITAVPFAAVNLYPDPSSLILPTGVLSDGTGAFSFPGVPLGQFSIQVSTSDHRGATVVGSLTAPNEITNLLIPLPSNAVYYAEIRGTVYDSDNVTPIPNATVYVGHYGGSKFKYVLARATTDTTGAYDVTNVPIAPWDVAAVTFDRSRQGVRQSITPVADQPTYVNITLQTATTVYGQVQFDNGEPVPGALVAGGMTLVTTDTNGNFTLQGVPVGVGNISAGLQANPAAGIPFTRLGGASLTVVPGDANYVVVKLNAAGRIYGTVYDAQGNPKPNIEVGIPDPNGGGFYYTFADTNGVYSFPNMGLGQYIVSAPANVTAPQLDASEISTQLDSGSEAEILAAYQEAVTVFVGANDPLVNGDDLNFAPSAWGYNTANLNYDGANINADIHFIPQGSVSGTVLNGQGIPIGAEVQLTGLGPDENGSPTTTIRGEITSDPATGHFAFTNALMAGNWGLEAASPFYPTVVKTNGVTTEFNLNVTGIILQFPPVSDVNGSIAGHVYYPNGTLVGEGIQVHINIATNYQIETDTNGLFDTQTEFPAIGVTYEVDAFDPISGLKGQSFIAMTPGITNFVNVYLLSKSSEIQVTVLQASGSPAAGAQLELDQGTYPYDPPLFAVTDTNGMAEFNNLWAGTYSVMATFTVNSTRLLARGGASVVTNSFAAITLKMGATGTVQGTFVGADGITPVYGANVSIGNLGFASTETNGFFEFQGVPLGNYTITGADPVTGANAVTSATISYNGQVQTVELEEGALGVVNGLVVNSSGTGFAAGASVSLYFSDGLSPTRTVTSDPNGAFSFPGSPMGSFTLNATYTIPGTGGFIVMGRGAGTLSTLSNNVSVDIQLQPLNSLTVQVIEADGITPAQNTLVTVNGLQQDTSSNGLATFGNLRVPSTYPVTAISQIVGDQSDGVQTNFLLTSSETNPVVTLVLPGVGAVAGTVVGSDGSTPVNNAQVTLTSQNPLFANQTVTALTGSQGTFDFGDVPLGPYLVGAVSVALAASQSGTLVTNRQTNQVTLQLGGSGTILGEVVRADGVTPVASEAILIQFNSQSRNPGRTVYYTGADGKFQFDNVPLGIIQVSSAATNFDGIINFTTELATNGEILNLGIIPYDETDPMVVQVSPTNTAIGVPIAVSVELVFSKALASNSVSPTGIFIEATNGAVDATVTLLPDTNGVLDIVRITPTQPLQSLATYSTIVISGDLLGADGDVIGSGPVDASGRPLAASFESDFTTADQTPPVLLSIFPSNNAVQINPAAVPRLVFNKSLNPTNFVFTLTGPSGPVAGTPSLGINGQVMTFEPTLDLLPNATYSMTISNVFDLAGNAAVGQPYIANFATLVTVGPTISSLQLASNTVPLAGSKVTVVAVLATNKPGDTVAFTQDLNPIGTVSNALYQITATLPPAGSTIIRATATDQYGNQGQFVALTIAVQPPQPPTITFGGVFSDGFIEGVQTNFWSVSQTTPGLYTLEVTNGLLELAKFPSIGNPGSQQNVAVNLSLSALGGAITNDFSVQIAFTNAVIPGPGLDQIQLNLGFQDGSVFDDVYDNSAGVNVHVWNGSANGVTALTNRSGIFRINRTGSTVTGYFDNMPVYSESNTAAVTNINLVLQNNNGSDDDTSVEYHNFSLTGTSIKTQPVASGSLVTVEVVAAGDTSISNLSAVVAGAAQGNLVTTNGAEILAQGYVPSTATPYLPVQVFAQATDILGAQSGQQVLTLQVRDATPPTLEILSPTNNSHPTGPSFNLATVVSDNSSNVTLGLTVSGSLAFTQTLPVALTPSLPVTNVFAVPLTNAPTNGGPIFATITATDAASNTTVLTRTIWLPNTQGPAIASLLIVSNLPPIAGSNVLVEAILVSNALGDILAFTQDGVLVGVVTNAPYEIPIELPANGSTTISATAIDPFGNVGIPTLLSIAVQPNMLPSVEFTRVSPASGPVPSGSSFSVDVNALGNGNVFDITAAVGGAANSANFQANGTTLLASGFVPRTAIAGQQAQITAAAVDVLGRSTGPQVFNLTVSDGTPPALDVLTPAPNAQLTPSATLPIAVLIEDNSSNITLDVSITSSAFTNAQTIAVTLTPNTPVTNFITVPLPNEPTNGSAVLAKLVATDQAGNATTVNTIYWLPGTDTTVTWDRQALGQTLDCTNGPATYTWPDDNNWSQAVVLGTPCGAGDELPIQPSNWSTTNYPNGTNLDVVLGALGGEPANLDVTVALHSLTIESNGGLNMGNATTLSAVNFEFQGDGGMTRSGTAALNLEGGTMAKTAGTNQFTLDPSIVLMSYGGTLEVDSGTLALPGNNSSYTNGAFDVASNATLLLMPTGAGANFAGTFTGTGSGTVLLSNGNFSAEAGGVALDLPEPLLQWNGGMLAGVLTNLNALSFISTTTVIVSRGSGFYNSGLTRQTAAGALDVQQHSTIANLTTGIFDLEADGRIYSDDYSPQNFYNYGVLRKSGGTNTSTISISFNNLGGTVDVESGTLALANNGSSTNGAFTVGAGAALDLTGGQSPTWAGTMAGQGAGAVMLDSGTLTTTFALLNFTDGLFQWSGGIWAGSATNLNAVNLTGTNASGNTGIMPRNAAFFNAGLVRHSGISRLDIQQHGLFANLAGGTYDFENDGGIFSSDYSPQNFNNYGSLRKSAGTNTSVISIAFNNVGGMVDVESGSLSLANSGSSTNASYMVGPGAALDITGGQNPSWSGQMTGLGLGAALFDSGSLTGSGLALNFTNGLFQWNGGQLAGVASNVNVLSLVGTNATAKSGTVLRQGKLYNLGWVRHTGAAGLDIQQNAAFVNRTNGTYDFEGDGRVYTDDDGPQNFYNYGVLRKSGGTNTSTISISFDNLGGTVDVESGTLALANSGSSTNGAFTVGAGAALDLTGGQSPTWAGTMAGQGAGAVMLDSGTLTTTFALLNFTDGLFQWSGGSWAGSATNLNVVSLTGTNASGNTGIMPRNAAFFNAGLVRHSGISRLDIQQRGLFANLAGGTYDFENDGGIFSDDYPPQNFNNYGTLRKSAGTNTSVISIAFNNVGGMVDVESGSLSLANSGSSTNASYMVGPGAALDITGGQNPSWSGQMTGLGLGAALFDSGSLTGSGLALNFTNGLFQWNGGQLAGVASNVNVLSLVGTNAAAKTGLMLRGSSLYNLGLVRHTGAGGFDVQQNANIINLTNGTYDFAGDGRIYSDDYSPQNFSNYGTLRKSAGTNSSTISIAFANQGGAIEVDSGTLSLGSSPYVQGAGTFTVQLGGTNSGQWGQLTAGAITLSGPLDIQIAAGFVPQVGAQFQILSGSSVTGTFSALNVPNGITMSYRGNAVVATITSPIGHREVRSKFANETQLAISRVNDDQVTLQWEGSAKFVVESASSIEPGALWAPVTNIPKMVTTTSFSLELPITNNVQYFRLRQE